MAYRQPPGPARLRCAKCGSVRVIPGVRILDRYGDHGRGGSPLDVEVEGNPEALLFKDTVSGALWARICGDCGYTEMWTENHRELYEKHLTGLEGQDEGEREPAELEAMGTEAPPPPWSVRPSTDEGTECLSCGASIPPGEERCPACGWSWEGSESEPDGDG